MSQQAVVDLRELTPDEVRLLPVTAPPRDPLALVEETARLLSDTAGGPGSGA